MQSQTTYIQSLEQLLERFNSLILTFKKLEEYQPIEKTPLEIEQEVSLIQESVRYHSLFSPNESLKQVATQYLKLFLIPYYHGKIFGQIQNNNRKMNILQEKNYMIAFIKLIEHYHDEEDAPIFPKNLRATYKHYEENEEYQIPRDELITNEKEKRLIKQKFQNAEKIKQESDSRQSIIDYIVLCLYDAVNQIKLINEELIMLKYKQSLEKGEVEPSNEPIPKMKYWQIKKPEQIQDFIKSVPPPSCFNCSTENQRNELTAKVWQPNANQPTMTLDEVAEMEMKNLQERTEKQKKQQEENKEDTDSDKEEVDARQKKKAEDWAVWTEAHEKGAGNKGQY